MAADRGGAKRRPDARAPHRSKQQAKQELTTKPVRCEASQLPFDPVAHRSTRCGGLGAEPRHQKQCADGDEEDRRHQAKEACVEARGKPHGGNEQANDDEREQKPRGERGRRETMLARGAADHDR